MNEVTVKLSVGVADEWREYRLRCDLVWDPCVEGVGRSFFASLAAVSMEEN